MTKIFAGGILISTVVLGTFGAQAMTSIQDQDKAVEPQGRYLCAGATWPQIPTMCLEGRSGREVRYVSANSNGEITSSIVNRTFK